MPRLIEYISVGFCSGYGDGDYRVSMNVKNLSRKQMNELTVAMHWATQCAWDNWKRGQPEETPGKNAK